ncbi:pyridoxamine 5'-phosphate oxidase family protein [Amycolatopsis rhabdoformis]|uniref:Pyridoxamine 5'-phosphate oxidase family protein n=1 Tax=Amycolatopsis rhabdoformis TaxID=1448059 RepID=A0ABZ1I8N6_9PSEU|nr:pyridoxamine 5'-phosphate oxidase family protein [Amycolatopsis rhabdoformis]WSE29899.1 pyridoxamine 5'-phosphate oxidase family protein [Amycolatopsis rhabdoformis]
MALITEDMRRIVEDAMLSYVATVRPDGAPNLSPKGSVRVYDDEHLAFMDMASPGTVANLRRDPRVEVNSIDVVRRRGYRFRGTAEVRDPGDAVHTWLADWLLAANGPGYPFHHAVVIHVDEIRPVLSPAYTFGEATEEELIPAWKARYSAIGITQAERNLA